jgi:hypothetical protein
MMVQEHVSNTSARFRWEEEVLEETTLYDITVEGALLTKYSLGQPFGKKYTRISTEGYAVLI